MNDEPCKDCLLMHTGSCTIMCDHVYEPNNNENHGYTLLNYVIKKKCPFCGNDLIRESTYQDRCSKCQCFTNVRVSMIGSYSWKTEMRYELTYFNKIRKEFYNHKFHMKPDRVPNYSICV